jgi:Na+-transporting NADH:ubiquinone oxidoreductase subunit B
MSNSPQTPVDLIGLQTKPAGFPYSIYPYKQGTVSHRNDWVRTVAVLLVFFSLMMSVNDFPALALSTAFAITTILSCYSVIWLVTDSHPAQPTILQYCMLFSLFIPTGLSVHLVLFTGLFGLVFGEIIFGGRGYSFSHPVICGLCFLFIGWPEINPVHEQSYFIWLGLFVAATLLLLNRCVDPRALLPIVFSFVMLQLGGFAIDNSHPPDPIIAASILLLFMDPSVTPTTHLGRWIYGLLLGALLYLAGGQELSQGLTLRTTIMSGFFVSLLSPLIDWVVVRLSPQTGSALMRSTN